MRLPISTLTKAHGSRDKTMKHIRIVSFYSASYNVVLTAACEVELGN